MQNKNEINLENIRRMNEIANIYEATRQTEKSEKYHKSIIKICDENPKNEKLLQYKIHSLNCLNKPYKSLETTEELLDLNPYNMMALLNLARFIKGGLNV